MSEEKQKETSEQSPPGEPGIPGAPGDRRTCSASEEDPEDPVPAAQLEAGSVALQHLDVLAEGEILSDQRGPRGEGILPDEEEKAHPNPRIRPGAKTVKSR